MLRNGKDDEAVRLALDTAELLKQVAPRAAEQDPEVGDLAEKSREDLLDVLTRYGLFQDRRDAGRMLADLLGRYRGRDDVVVLGLPRGGVPVGYEAAVALDVPLDMFLVRKLGLPSRPELAMGAIASGGVVTVNDDVVRAFGVRPEVVQQVAGQEGCEPS